MRVRVYLLIGCLLAKGLVSSASEVSRASCPPQAPTVISENEEGFRAQIEAAVKAFRSGDESKGRQLIQDLRLPNPEAFFAGNFPPDESVRFTERYARAFTDYALSMEHTLKDVVLHADSELIQTLKPDEPETPNKGPSRLTSLQPQHELKLYRFRSAIVLKGKDLASWEETYLYLDGHFSFVGFGGWPVWSWEEANEPHAFKNGHFVTMPEAVRKVSPKYPHDARKQKVEGTVVLEIRVHKDGSVGNIKVISGHPLLVPAAIEALQQWRYQPATMGGSPFELPITVSIIFSLHGG